ncbi:MAG: response regulator transcription factor [Rubrivivax sp.]|nr:response regulator transcription factor [Rubrivivax sp.]
MGPGMRCLLVDDDPGIRQLLQAYLQQHGMTVEALVDGAGLRRRLPAPDVDLLILDLMLPDDNGLTLCQWVREVQPALPLIMLTAQGDPISRVLGLEMGADDYLPKPFEPRELVARIKAVLRRGRGTTPRGDDSTELHFQGWTFDRLRRQLVAPDGSVVALSAAEFRLLTAFCAHPRKALSRERLLDLTRAAGTEVNDRSIDLAVSRLRAKLGDGGTTPTLIRTLRGEGYLFDTELR